LGIEDSNSLAEKICDLYNNPELMKILSNNNKEKIKSFYIDQIAYRYLELL
jgi:glycosyltransferase involved in cell wall biosynthesis